MKAMLFPILFSTVASMSALHAQEIDIPAQENKNLVLGLGFDSEKYIRRGECVTGTEVSVGKQTANISYTQSLVQEEIERELGLAAGFRYRNGMTTTSASATFAKSSKSSKFSISSTYMGTYVFKDKILTNRRITNNMAHLMENPERFRSTCGDRYAFSQSYGAKIFFNIKIEFKTESSKREFETKFNLSGPMVDVSASLKEGKKKFSRDTQVTVQGLQIGGDVSLISKMFNKPGSNDGTASREFIKCTFGDLDKCEEVLANAVHYVVDDADGFPSQIANEANHALLETVVTDYATLGVNIDFTPEVQGTIKIARDGISEHFEKVLDQYQTVRGIMSNSALRLSQDQTMDFREKQSKLYDAMIDIANASEICYDEPKNCIDEKNRIFKAYPEDTFFYTSKDFDVEPEIFAQYCDLGVAPFTEFSYHSTVKSLVNYAELLNADLFSNDGTDKDECYLVEKQLLEADEVDLSLDFRREEFPKEENHVNYPEMAEEILTNFLPLVSLPHLKVINLEGNQIKDLSIFRSFNSLESLNLAANELSNVDVLWDLSKITQLNLSNNLIKDISSLSQLENIQRLDLVNNLYDLECPFSDTNICLFVDYRRNFSLIPYQRFNDAMRWGADAIVTNFGNVYITGGRFDSNSKKVDMFSTYSEDFNTSELNLERNRYDHKTLLLDDDSFLVVGGWQSSKSYEHVDPRERRVQIKDLPSSFIGGEVIKLKNGDYLLTGGFSGNSSSQTGFSTSTSAMLYSSEAKKFRSLPSMNIPRAGHTMTLLPSGKVLIIGGMNPKISLNSMEIFDPKTKKFSSLNLRLKRGRAYHTTEIVGNKVYVFGGFYENQQATDSVEVIDLNRKKVFDVKKTLENKRAYHRSVVLDNGKILLVGGASQHQTFITENQSVERAVMKLEIFDPAIEESFELYQELYSPRVLPAMVKLDGQRLLLIGGKGQTSSKTALMFDYSVDEF